MWATSQAGEPVYTHVPPHSAGPIEETRFTTLVESTSARLLRTAYLVCGDLDRAAELVEETWTRVAREWSIVGAAAQPEILVRRALITLTLDRQPVVGRRSGAGRADSSSDRRWTPSRSLVGRRGEVSLQRVEDQLELEMRLKALTHRQRAVLVLRFDEALTEHEAAEVLSCSVGTVQRTAQRALPRTDASRALVGETFEWLAAAVTEDHVEAVLARDYGPVRTRDG